MLYYNNQLYMDVQPQKIYRLVAENEDEIAAKHAGSSGGETLYHHWRRVCIVVFSLGLSRVVKGSGKNIVILEI